MRRDLTRAELIALVEELYRLEPMEERSDELLALLDANVPYPGGELFAVVFGPYLDFSEPDETAAELVDRLLAYRPIITPPPRQP